MSAALVRVVNSVAEYEGSNPGRSIVFHGARIRTHLTRPFFSPIRRQPRKHGGACRRRLGNSGFGISDASVPLLLRPGTRNQGSF
jgi:hypothetical protein